VVDVDHDWLRDYESIEVDLRGMTDYAAALRAELERNYGPHREQVNRDMTVDGPRPDGRFRELCRLLERHWTSRALTTALLTEHGNATWTLAAAAQEVSRRYGDADGFAHARAADVQGYLRAGGGQ
jgi:hypothetical protein